MMARQPPTVRAFEMVPEKRGAETVIVSKPVAHPREESYCRGCGKPKPSCEDEVSGFRWCFKCFQLAVKCKFVRPSDTPGFKGELCGARVALEPCARCGIMKCGWCHEGHKCKFVEATAVVEHRAARKAALCEKCGGSDVALLECGGKDKGVDLWRCKTCGDQGETPCAVAKPEPIIEGPGPAAMILAVEAEKGGDA